MKRGRNQRRRQGVNPNRALDSNGPEVRIRGTANQIYDKYINLARDASSAGDRIKAESYLQHAEHYFRVIRSMQPPQQQAAPYAGDGEQPSVSDDASADRASSQPRQSPTPSEDEPQKSVEAETKDQPAAASDADAATNDADKDGEKKPRRRTRKRRVKATDEAGETAAAAPSDNKETKEKVAAAAE